jgi:exonuclease 3'-5' domain-containing protein 1
VTAKRKRSPEVLRTSSALPIFTHPQPKVQAQFTMSIESGGIETTVVDSVSLLQSVIDAVVQLPTYIPSLFMDLEGIQLGRHGSISIMSLYLRPKKRVYLIDIHRLGAEAFSTVNSAGKSLKFILESSVILKVLFDVRHDSDALFSHYGISVDGIRDVQLMELATRQGSKDFIAGLSKCVEKDSSISAAEKNAWELTKRNTRRLFDPAFGGRYDIFNERPIQPIIAEYCAGDVTLLPDLFNTYNDKLRQPNERFWEVRVLEATKERIKLSQSPRFDGTSRTNARGPWDDESTQAAIDQWNDDILDNAMMEEDVYEESDYWEDDGPTSCRDIINDWDYDYYYSD